MTENEKFTIDELIDFMYNVMDDSDEEAIPYVKEVIQTLEDMQKLKELGECYVIPKSGTFEINGIDVHTEIEELEQYRAIGTVEEMEVLNRIAEKTVEYLKEDKELLAKYKRIGTIDELRELKEKNKPKKIKGIRHTEAICPSCEIELYETYWAFGGIHYCSNCGQKIDWE